MNEERSAPSFVDRIKAIMGERQGEYAHPQDNHQLTADMFDLWWKTACRHKVRRKDMTPPINNHNSTIPFTAEDICIFNIIQKLSRLAFATHDDSLLDVVGYCENISMLRPEQRNSKKEASRSIPEMTLEEITKQALELARHGDYRNGVENATGSLDEGECKASAWLENLRHHAAQYGIEI